jgi:hypothetical protein
VVAEESSALGKFVHIWSVDLGVVVAYVSPALVIGQDNDYIGLGSKKLSPDQEYWKQEKPVHGSLIFLVFSLMIEVMDEGVSPLVDFSHRFPEDVVRLALFVDDPGVVM